MFMKHFPKLAVILTIFVVGSMFLFQGCQDTNPLEPESVQTEISNADSQNLEFIAISDIYSDAALAKPTTVYEWISAEKGGELIIAHNWNIGNNEDGNGGESVDGGEYADNIDYKDKTKIYISLEVLPDALEQDTRLSMSLAENSLVMTFGPHGTTFSYDALLNIKVLGLNLMHAKNKRIDIYYLNEDTGLWQQIERDQVKVNYKHGNIFVKNARLPHFSRYAVAYGK